MKNVVEFMFFTFLTIVLTVVRINYVTANLIEVDETCAPKIHGLFKNCESGCKTLEDKIKFIFLHISINNLQDDKNKIVKDYIVFISQAIDKKSTEQKMKTPWKFCSEQMKEKTCSDKDFRTFFGDESLMSYTNKNKVPNCYFQFSIDQNSTITEGLKMYVDHVQNSIQFSNDFKGPHVPEEFCEMKQCSNDIRSDIPDIADDGPIYTDIVGKSIWLNVVYNDLKNNSKGYVDQFFKAMIVKDIINEKWSIKNYCAEYLNELEGIMENTDYDKLQKLMDSKKDWEDDCQSFFKTYDFNLTNDEANLKHIFYNISKKNIHHFKIESLDVELDYVLGYVVFVSQYLKYDDSKMILAPEHYCIAAMENQKK